MDLWTERSVAMSRVGKFRTQSVTVHAPRFGSPEDKTLAPHAGLEPRPGVPHEAPERGGGAGRRGLFRSATDLPAGYIREAFTFAATSAGTQAPHTSSLFLRKCSAASLVVAWFSSFQARRLFRKEFDQETLETNE